MKSLIQYICVVVLSFSQATWAADDLVDEPMKDLPFTYAMYAFPPWLIKTEEGFGGISMQYEKEIEKRINIDMQLVEMTVQRSFICLKKGEIDGFTAPDDPKLRQFAEPYINFGNIDFMMFTRPENSMNLEQLLQGGKVATTKILNASLFFDNPDIQLIHLHNGFNALHALDIGHVDGVILSEVSYRHIAATRGWNYQRMNQTLLKSIPLYLWVSKQHKNKAQLDKINQAVNKIRKQNLAQKILNGQLSNALNLEQESASQSLAP